MSYKISYCIVAMNRLHHLKQTLPANITDNEDYGNIEFILLDYNSADHLEEYIQLTFSQYLENGLLKYYRTVMPEYFNRSHSRNVAFRLATGDILCNLDADNYTGKYFARYINEEFSIDKNIFLSSVGASSQKDILGRICMKRDDFYAVKGYDERLVNYGFEDYDIANRLEMTGLRRQHFETDYSFLKVVPHQQKERLTNEFAARCIRQILISYLTPSSTDLIFFFNDHTFKRYIYVDHQTFVYPEPLTTVQLAQMDYRYSLTDAPFKEGKWIENDDGYSLVHEDEFRLFYDEHEDHYKEKVPDPVIFCKVTDPEVVEELIMIYSAIPNRMVMTENLLNGKAIVNELRFGSEELYENFSNQSFNL